MITPILTRHGAVTLLVRITITLQLYPLIFLFQVMITIRVMGNE